MDRKTEFVERLVSRVREQAFPDYVKATPQAIAEGLRDRDWYVSAEVVDGPVALGASKVGGQPGLPASLEWPCEEDTESPLAFVAQINLEEVARHDFLGRLPSRGMLWLFCIADGDRAYGHEIDETTSRAIYLAEPGALTSREIPEELTEDEDATIEEKGLVFGPCISLTGIHDVGIVDPIVAALRELGGRRGPLHVLTPASPQGSFEDEWDEDDEDDEDRDEDGDDDAEADPSPRLTLIDLDGYAIARNAFGEGTLEVVVTTAALERGDLSKIDVVYVSGS